MVRALAAAAAAIALMSTTLLAAPAAMAGDVSGSASSALLAGPWSAVSLRGSDPGVGMGYTLFLRDVAGDGSAYRGYFRFHYQDGRTGKRIRVRVVPTGRYTVDIVMPGGSLADGTKVLKGTIGQGDGSLTVRKCWTELPWTTKANSGSFCWFQGETLEEQMNS